MTDLRQVTRIGVYGVIVQNEQILLIQKKGEGCYQGLLDLPGGGVEFGETPEETLRREIKEEVGMIFEDMHWMHNLSHHRKVHHVSHPFAFHHIGQIYRIKGETFLLDAQPEETFDWFDVHHLSLDKLTPFAQQAVLDIKKNLF